MKIWEWLKEHWNCYKVKREFKRYRDQAEMKIQELIEKDMRSKLSIAGYSDYAIRKAVTYTLDLYTRRGDLKNAINHGLDYAKRNLKHERKVKHF